MMGSYFPIGGLALEPPFDFFDRVQTLIKILPGKIDEYQNLLTGNPIWVSRPAGKRRGLFEPRLTASRLA